jgi:hypothetical protein
VVIGGPSQGPQFLDPQLKNRTQSAVSRHEETRLMTFPRPSTGLVAILASTLLATQALAQDYRPDAKGYPCDARARLAVVQDDQGYSIRPLQRPAEIDKPAVPSRIAIGAALRVDARIFAFPARAAREVSHASRR